MLLARRLFMDHKSSGLVAIGGAGQRRVAWLCGSLGDGGGQEVGSFFFSVKDIDQTLDDGRHRDVCIRGRVPSDIATGSPGAEEALRKCERFCAVDLIA